MVWTWVVNGNPEAVNGNPEVANGNLEVANGNLEEDHKLGPQLLLLMMVEVGELVV
jgi:hypothetical protein